MPHRSKMQAVLTDISMLVSLRVCALHCYMHFLCKND